MSDARNPGDESHPSLASTLIGERISDQVGAVIGPYKLMEQIGEGGFGLVFVAEQLRPVKRRVALKIIKPGMDTRDVIARFEAERQALALMDHPNIARVLDVGATDSGRPYFVMELVRGLAITDYCDQNHLTPRERLELFVTVCHAVQHAHQKGIIHRDIKPSNVLVTVHEGRAVVKVIDFGVAKALHQQLTDKTIYTRFAQVIGTPLYMSPEQAAMTSLDIDTRSDIYSLGVLLYELLTGTTPFDRKRLAKAAYDELIRIIRDEEPPKPSTRLSESTKSLPAIAAQRKTEPAKLSRMFRGDLDWITMKALEKDRTRRYETASGLAADVVRYLHEEPVEAGPPSARYRLRKVVRRYRRGLLVAAVFALLLVTATAVSVWEAVRARRAEQTALRDRDRAITAEASEAEQRASAERARDRTREALDAMTSTVTGDALTTQKEISADQKKFLTEVLKYYQQFAGEKADDETSRARTAAAAYRVGTIESRLGRKEQAARAFRMATDGYTVLMTDFPAVSEYRHQLGRSHNELGFLLAGLGKRPEGNKEYQEALTILEKLVTDFPAEPEYRLQLASSHLRLGILLAELGTPSEAEREYRRALAIGEKLADDFPAVPDYRSNLGDTHADLGKLLMTLGKRSEAEEDWRKALAIREKLVADFPAVPRYRQALAVDHSDLGALLQALGKRTEAEDEHRKSLVIREKLAADFPAVPEYRSDLARGHGFLGILLHELGKRSEEEEETRKALAIQEKLAADYPEVPGYRYDLATSRTVLALSQVNAGRVTEGIAEIAEWAKSSDWDRDNWYNFACVYAVASGKSPQKKQVYGDRAMELLNKAVKAGFKDAAHFQRDNDLSSLRDRDDFKKLIAELTNGKQAAKKP